MTPPVTERFATFVAETDYSAISPRAIENARLHILDTLGVALAGYASSPPNSRSGFAASRGSDRARRPNGTRYAPGWGLTLAE